MYNKLTLAFKYLRYYLTASNGKGHGTHSPFVFDFIKTVLNDRQHYPAYDTVEKLRKDLLNDRTTITVEDFGAGSSVDKSSTRTIASIAKNAAKPAKYGQLLYRMVKRYHPSIVVELGTSLGITTSYMALALNYKGGVVSLEGAAEVANVAKQNFNALHILNVAVIEGDFDITFRGLIRELYPVHFCFVDGNHRREPTERYFQDLLLAAEPETILVFDDIHWSREMEQAWETIKNHELVRYTIDLFFIGIVFFREEFREKQHFTIRF